MGACDTSLVEVYKSLMLAYWSLETGDEDGADMFLREAMYSLWHKMPTDQREMANKFAEETKPYEQAQS